MVSPELGFAGGLGRQSPEPHRVARVVPWYRVNPPFK